MKPRLAILGDYPEEGWPSMDLVAQMLLEEMTTRHADVFDARSIRPPYRRYFGWASRNADRLWNRHFAYPRYIKKRAGDFDLFHICDHSYAQLVHVLPADRTGVFCHDLDTFRCLLDPAAERRPRWFRAMARRSLTGMQKAAIVFYTTESVRQQVERHGLIDPAKLVKTPLGVAPEFTPGKVEDRAQNPPFLLHVGSCIPRKRIDVLLDVFAAVRAAHLELRLVQVGGEWTEQQRQQIASPSPLYTGERAGVRGSSADAVDQRTAPRPNPLPWVQGSGDKSATPSPPYSGERVGVRGGTSEAGNQAIDPATPHPARVSSPKSNPLPWVQGRGDRSGDITQLRDLERMALAGLYRRASVVLVPSEAEGFGLPIIEALACGAIVVASDLPVLREVGGDAVTYCPVGGVDEWVRTVGRLLDNPASAPPLDVRLRQANRYSWEEYGRVIAAAYDRIRPA